MNSLYFLNNLKNFNETFTKGMTCENIKSNEKHSFILYHKNTIFGKTTMEDQIDHMCVPLCEYFLLRGS